jgi:ABC-type polysaccharide/polyol phosphate export permease
MLYSFRLPKTSTLLAAEDLTESVRLYKFWLKLGWEDVLQRYRGSILGPFWITITNLIFILALGPLYAHLLSLRVEAYLPSLALGLIFWSFITSTVNEGCALFITNAHLMKQVRLPRLALLLQMIWRNILVIIHSIPVIVIVLLFYGPQLSGEVFLALSGFVLTTLNVLWIAVLVSFLCARFRDLIPIVAAVLQVAFFLTPIMWLPTATNLSSWFIYANPFASLIDVIRGPLLGSTSYVPFIFSGAYLCVGSFLSVGIFVKYRRQLIFWV